MHELPSGQLARHSQTLNESTSGVHGKKHNAEKEEKDVPRD